MNTREYDKAIQPAGLNDRQAEPWYLIHEMELLDTPALVVYPQRVKENVNLLVSSIDDTGRLRPHIKTHKCREAALLTMAAGILKFKCATIAEAEMLGSIGAADVLLAYQPSGPKLVRLFKLIGLYPATLYSCLVDNQDSADEISSLALSYGLKPEVYIDLNIGMNRTGILPEDGAADLYLYCRQLEGITIRGLHCYDGHIHDADLNIRKERCEAWFGRLEKLRQQLHEKGIPDPVIIAGGTPTFPLHAARTGIECSPGTFIYWDKGYQQACGEQAFLTAALVISRVISLPDKTKICLDLGHKSIASENEISRRVVFLNAPGLVPVSQSEEHLVMEAGAGHTYKIGDVLYGLPWHICPTVALYERAITIENNKLSGEWLNLSRNRMLTI